MKLIKSVSTLKQILLGAWIALSMIAFAQAESMDGAIKLTGIQGEVLVNTSGKYEVTTSETSVSSNTKILLRQQSRADIVFPNGCKVSLTGGNIYKAGTEADCKQGVVNIVGENESAVASTGATGTGAGGGASVSPVLLGGAAVLVIGGIAAASSGGSKQNECVSACD